MNTLFIILFLASAGILITGLLKPSFFAGLLKRPISRKQIGIAFGIATFLCFVLIGVTAPAKEEVKNSTGGNVQTQIETQTEPATTEKIESAVVPIPAITGAAH
ncbi:MAG: hypothetical protein ACYC5F_09600 [Thermoleophilia bacterium]